MKYLRKIWDMILFVFAFSTTKHCDKLNWDKQDDFFRGNDSKK